MIANAVFYSLTVVFTVLMLVSFDQNGILSLTQIITLLASVLVLIYSLKQLKTQIRDKIGGERQTREKLVCVHIAFFSCQIVIASIKRVSAVFAGHYAD